MGKRQKDCERCGLAGQQRQAHRGMGQVDTDVSGAPAAAVDHVHDCAACALENGILIFLVHRFFLADF
jgi:hypothetical protein